MFPSSGAAFDPKNRTNTLNPQYTGAYVSLHTHSHQDAHSQVKLALSDVDTLQKSDTGIISFHEH